MDEKIPELTLTPELDTAPELELSPQKEEKPAAEAGSEFSSLSPAEQKAVLDFAEKIDLTNTSLVLQYGARDSKKYRQFLGVYPQRRPY